MSFLISDSVGNAENVCGSMNSHRYDDSNRSKEAPDEVIVCSQPTSTHTNKSQRNKNLQNNKASLGAEKGKHNTDGVTV